MCPSRFTRTHSTQLDLRLENVLLYSPHVDFHLFDKLSFYLQDVVLFHVNAFQEKEKKKFILELKILKIIQILVQCCGPNPPPK